MKPWLVLFAAILCACAGANRLPHAKGYSVTGSDPFVFEVERGVLREWGGANSARFNEVLEEELERLRICRSGYVLRNEGTRDDVFRVTGRCRR